MSVYTTENQKFFYVEVLRSYIDTYRTFLNCQLDSNLFIHKDQRFQPPVKMSGEHDGLIQGMLETLELTVHSGEMSHEEIYNQVRDRQKWIGSFRFF